jgi:lipopolysaccharide transport system permease protein
MRNQYRYLGGRGSRLAGMLRFTNAILELMSAPFQAIGRHRTILVRTTVNEVRNQFAGSLLGIAWIVIGQLLVLAIYATTYVVIFRIRPADMSVYEYILYVFCGLTSFLPFANGLSAGAVSLVSNRAVLLNTIFPAELIPLRSVVVASVTMPVGAIILACADALLSQVSWTTLLLPLVMTLQIMFVAGLVWILSLVALVVRDVQHVIQYSVMMLAIITPIAYTPPMVPDVLKAMIYLNPLSYYVISFQYLIILNRLPEYQVLIPMLVLSVGMFVLGYNAVRRAKGAFFDYA